MNIQDVPQDRNSTLAGHQKAVYARGPDGRIVAVGCTGWEAEEIVTLQAVDVFAGYARDARARVLAGRSAPLEYWMYARRMDLATFAQSSGVWRWRIRRHFRPQVYARLGPALRQRYADALGLPVAVLDSLPS